MRERGWRATKGALKGGEGGGGEGKRVSDRERGVRGGKREERQSAGD